MTTAEVSETVLVNGMALVEMPMAGRLATTIVIAFPAGARHERADEVGAAHLLEHMAFKGTENYRTARELNRAAEYLGTELDGTATNDVVELYTAVKAESAMAAIELLVELAGKPLLEQTGLEGERTIVLQEIADAHEDPSTRADGLLLAALFDGHRLAKGTVGEATDLRRLTHERMLAFHDRQWTPRGGLVTIAGNLDHVDRPALRELLERIPDRPAGTPAPPTPAFDRRIKIEEHDSDVAHLRLAYAVPGVDLTRRHDRAVAEVFSQLIGGPMGSRLFDQLREQRSLCYWIDGYIWGYEDAAFLSVPCSVRPSTAAETYGHIQAIVADLHKNGPTVEEASRAGRYASGAATLDFESSSALADHATQLIMEYGDHDIDPALHLESVEAVTHRDLCQLAACIEPGPCVAAVGPVAATDFD